VFQKNLLLPSSRQKNKPSEKNGKNVRKERTMVGARSESVGSKGNEEEVGKQ
jgi:hypothetical protein